jgi:hypothetical protein
MPLGSTPDSRPLSVVVLGADAVLAALPATPVQLAHACRSLGYDVAFPASWGDEVVAGACLERLGDFGDGPTILCSCPVVTERLTRSGSELAPFMMNLVAPPVAAARYLRALYGERELRITYAGACPSATDPSIDARISPAELLLAFEERGIVPAAQPELFDSVLPPDRRRYNSIPGGAPSAERIGEVAAGCALTELECGDDDIALDIVQRLVTRQCEVIDLAPRLGCACSGAQAGGEGSAGRQALIAIEPPRASAPVLDPTIRVETALPSPAEPAGAARYRVAWAPREHDPEQSYNPEVRLAGARVPAGDAPPARPAAVVRRRPAVKIRRSAGRAPALVRDDGALIPRAYAARLARARDAALLDPRPESGERKHRGQVGTTADGARRPKRVTRSVIIPLSSEPPRVVPPPPARHRPGSGSLEIGAVASDI